VRVLSRVAPLLLGFALTACGAATTERPVEDYLRVGVDMRTECNSVSDALVEAGLVVTRRRDAPRFCALSAASRDGARSAVRIVTSRGIVYSADGARDGLPGATLVTLIAPPGGHDGPELLVARAESALTARCIEVIQVDAQGGAQAIPLELDALAAVAPVDARTCIGEILDVDGDGTAEAHVIVRALLLAAPQSRAPAVRVPLAPGPSGFVYVAPPATHWQRERSDRAERLAQARMTRDFAAAHTVAVELALLARLAGEGASAQRAAYDEGIAGLSIGVAQEALIDAVHAAFADE